jgi:GNAT superfamily N-acetyltransferase
METRPLDAFDDEQMRAFYDVSWRAEMEDGRPWNGHWTFEELADQLRTPSGDHRLDGVAAYDGETLVGAGVIGRSLHTNLDKAWVFPMVDPPCRRRGAGSALVEALVETARADGRTTVQLSATYAGPEDEDAPAMRFARKHGFHLSQTEISRRLRLPVDDALLDALEAEASAHADGYTVETFTGCVPDEHLASYCALVNLLGVDAPHGDVEQEESSLTPDTVRDDARRNEALGREVFGALAVKGGEAVAQTDIAVQPGETGKALQWGTYVHRDHRGHRLGTAVKVANLRALQRGRPDVRQVDTQNAETNRWMVGINERLGFEVYAVTPQFVRRLA